MASLGNLQESILALFLCDVEDKSLLMFYMLCWHTLHIVMTRTSFCCRYCGHNDRILFKPRYLVHSVSCLIPVTRSHNASFYHDKNEFHSVRYLFCVAFKETGTFIWYFVSNLNILNLFCLHLCATCEHVLNICLEND